MTLTEKRQRQREYSRRSYARMTEEQKAKKREDAKRWRANMTDAQKAKAQASNKARRKTEKERLRIKAWKKSHPESKRRYIEKHRHEWNSYMKARHASDRASLSDTYLKNLLVQNSGLSVSDIPPELIALQRAHLKLKRKLKATPK